MIENTAEKPINWKEAKEALENSTQNATDLLEGAYQEMGTMIDAYLLLSEETGTLGSRRVDNKIVSFQNNRDLILTIITSLKGKEDAGKKGE